MITRAIDKKRNEESIQQDEGEDFFDEARLNATVLTCSRSRLVCQWKKKLRQPGKDIKFQGWRRTGIERSNVPFVFYHIYFYETVPKEDQLEEFSSPLKISSKIHPFVLIYSQEQNKKDPRKLNVFNIYEKIFIL